MGQNITWLGASYSGVEQVTLPKTGGGTCTFYESGGGGTPVVTVVDTLDVNGGTIRDITAIDISDTTAVASDVASGKYFYTADGTKTAGAASGGGGGATQHTIHLEFTDSTDTDIEVDYDDSLIATMITAYTPVTYSSKTVTLAQLDGVTWYSYTPGTWETVYNGTTQLISDTPYPYFWISSLSDVSIPVGSTWRVTMDGVQSGDLVATNSQYGGMIGNPLYSGGSDDGSGLKYDFFNAGWGAWSGGADLATGNHTVKIERLVSS